MSALPTFHELTNIDGYANTQYLTESHLIGSTELSVARIENNPEGHYPDPPCSQFVLTLITKGSGNAIVDVGPGQYTCKHRKGTLMLAPPAVSADYVTDYTFDVSLLGMSNALFEDAFTALGGENASSLEQLYSNVFEDKFVEHLVNRMVLESNNENPNGALFVDQATHLLVTALLDLAGRVVKPCANESRPLTADQLTLITDLLEDRIQEKVNLDQLAAQFGWNKFHFIRAFKAATGQAPYQYLLERRVARASDMLTSTNERLVDIAYDCGFSSQSHLTSTFTKFMGITPGAYRNEVRR